MKGSVNNVLEAIGNTPIVKLNTVTAGIDSEIYAKLEYLNPGGSIKDRIGCHMLEQAIKRGDITKGGTVIEATSGNTGMGLALYSIVHGLKIVFVMADKQSKEKVDILKSAGAEVILCPTNVEPDDPRSYYSVSKKLSEETPNSFFVNQYDNPDNGGTHINWTGPEIFEQTEGDFDVFMASVGTGGTISGIGKYLKSKMPNVKIVGVDIEGSILAPFKKTGKVVEAKPYLTEGIGEDIFPENVNFNVIDDFAVINDQESFDMARDLFLKEGLFTGGSGGSAVAGAIKYAKSSGKKEKILVILPDSGSRYLGKVYNNEWLKEKGLL